MTQSSEAVPSPLEMVAVRPPSETLAARIEAVGEALAAGQPAASLELIRQVGADANALIYWAAIRQRFEHPEFGTALAEMDALLAEASEAGEDWSKSDEAELTGCSRLTAAPRAASQTCSPWRIRPFNEYSRAA